jgi:hypothetical protein
VVPAGAGLARRRAISAVVSGSCPRRQAAAGRTGLRAPLGIDPAPEEGGGDGADGRCGHDQHGVPGDRGVEPDLGLIQAEAVLPSPELLFRGPSQPRPRGSAGSGSSAGPRARSSSETPAPGAQVAADQQAVLRGSGSQPGPAVPALAPGSPSWPNGPRGSRGRSASWRHPRRLTAAR